MKERTFDEIEKACVGRISDHPTSDEIWGVVTSELRYPETKKTGISQHNMYEVLCEELL